MAGRAEEPKFLIDACLTRALIEHLRHHRGIDAIRVDDVLPADATDDAVLSLARSQGRLVVTENARDFRRLAAMTPAHPGLVIVAGGLGKAAQIALCERAVDRILDDLTKGRSPRGQVYEIAADGTVERMKLKR